MPRATKKTASAKKTASKASVKAAAKETVVATPPAPPAPAKVEQIVESTSTDPSLSDDFSEFMGHLTALRSQLSTLTTEFRALQKRSERETRRGTPRCHTARLRNQCRRCNALPQGGARQRGTSGVEMDM